LQHIVIFGQITQWAEKHTYIGNCRHKRTQTDGLIQYVRAAVKNHRRHGRYPQHFDHRHENGENVYLFHSQPVVFIIQIYKIIKIGFLPRESLDGADTLDGFRESPVDFGHLHT